MRASVLVLGPLLARFGRAKVSLPGGCAIGARPIDQHLKGLEAHGRDDPARARLRHRRVQAPRAAPRSSSTCPTVTGTENLMMAAALAKGRTTLVNCAREPEIEELGRVLNKMGATRRRRRHRRHPHRGHATSSRPSITRSSPTASRPARTWSRRPRPAATCCSRAPRSTTSRRVVAKLRAGRRRDRARGRRACACAARRARSARSTSPPRRTRASRPTCRRSSWC